MQQTSSANSQYNLEFEVGAAVDGDYTASDTGTVTFAAGASTAIVTVDPTADTTVEPDETVILTVTAGADYNIGGTGQCDRYDYQRRYQYHHREMAPASIAEDAAGVMTHLHPR